MHLLGIFEYALETPHRTCAIFHVAGDEDERIGYLDYMMLDDELIADELEVPENLEATALFLDEETRGADADQEPDSGSERETGNE